MLRHLLRRAPLWPATGAATLTATRTAVCNGDELELVHATATFRHGARCPVFGLDSDVVKRVTWDSCAETARLSDGVDLDKDAVLKAMETDTTLVDTLKPSSFDGSTPSRYGRRGHIATATNVPYESLLDEAGCFLPEDELRRAFAAAGVGDEPVLAY